LSLLAWTHSSSLSIQTAHAQGGPINIITNADFEGGVYTDSRGFQVPNDWSFEVCEGVGNATVNVDSLVAADGKNSTRVDTGPVTPSGCFPGNYTGRAVGFSQFRQSLGSGSNSGYNFTQLTNDPAGLSFWFKLQPENSNGMAVF